jgi:hypothetical protein
MHTHGLPKLKRDVPGRFTDPRIIEFRPRPRPGKRVPAPVVDPLLQFEIDDRRRRMQQNMAAVVVLVLLVGGGLWLFHQLKESSRMLVCIEAGRSNCQPLGPTHRQSNAVQ